VGISSALAFGENDLMTERFTGFSRDPFDEEAGWWPYPNELGMWWHTISKSEHKVLDYILRHTIGFQKKYDAISYEQFIHGVANCDKGCGVKSTATLKRAFDGLIRKGFITSTGDKFSGHPIRYSLVFKGDEMRIPPLSELKSWSSETKQGTSLDSKDTTYKIPINNLQYINSNYPKKYPFFEDIKDEDVEEISNKCQVPIGLVRYVLEDQTNLTNAIGFTYRNCKVTLEKKVLKEKERYDSANERLRKNLAEFYSRFEHKTYE